MEVDHQPNGPSTSSFTAPSFAGAPLPSAAVASPYVVYKPNAPPAISLAAELIPEDQRTTHYLQHWVKAVVDAKHHLGLPAGRATPPKTLLHPASTIQPPKLHFSYQPRLATMHDATFRAMLAAMVAPPCDTTIQVHQHRGGLAGFSAQHTFASSSSSSKRRRIADPPAMLPHLTNPAAQHVFDATQVLGTIVDSTGVQGDVGSGVHSGVEGHVYSVQLPEPSIRVGYQVRGGCVCVYSVWVWSVCIGYV